MADLQAQCADGVVDDLGFVGAEKEDVAVLRAGALQHGGQGLVVQVFDDGRLQALAAFGGVIDLDPGQALGTVNLHEVGVAVDFAPADFAAAGHAQRHHAPAGRAGRAAEDFEVHIAHHVCQFGEFELHAQIGLVGAEAVHGLGVGHDGEFAQFHAQRLPENLRDHFLEQAANVLLVQKRGFDIDLREFRLAVGAQVFVAEALGDLVVAVKAGHHQQLLEELGRLRQREKVPVMHAAGHQVIARAFGRALGEHGCFDVDEAVLVQKLAHGHRHAVAQHEVALHHGAAQIQHAVRQARGLAQVLVVKLEGRRDGRVEHFQLVAQHFHLAAFEAVVRGAFRAGTHQACDLHAELVAQVFRRFEHGGAVGVANHLHIAFAVAQVDEDHAAVVAPAVHPAAQGYGLAVQRLGHEAAVVGAHRHDGLSWLLARMGNRVAEGGSGRGSSSARRRGHHAHGNHVFERLIHAHGQIHHVGAARQQEVA